MVTPGSSLAKGDWGLKRPLPEKSTLGKSSRPVVRVIEQDTFEHVTDFESASDHVMTLEKFQDLNMPISLLSRVNYSVSHMPEHISPFEEHLDNTERSQGRHNHNAKMFRQSGPSLGDLTEAQFSVYLKRIQRQKPKLFRKLRQVVEANRLAQRRKKAQDNGEDMENIQSEMSDDEFMTQIKAMRTDPTALGPIIYELLDIPSASSSPGRMPKPAVAFESPPTKLAAIEYAKFGPPKTHPSAGLSYQRSHTQLYNHPHYGPQASQRPVEARILRPKTKTRGGKTRAVAGIAGVAVEDVNAINFTGADAPAGLGSFDASIPGGGKYWVSPCRAYVNADGKILLSSLQATAASKAVYGLEDHKGSTPTRTSGALRNVFSQVPQLDRPRPYTGTASAGQSGPEAATRHLLRSMGGT